MRTRSFFPLNWHTLVCAALGCAFLVVGAPRVWEECRPGVGPVAAFHTTDYFLSALLGTPGGSKRLIHVFSALPVNTPVAVMVPEGDWGNTFTAYILTYFGWPREVRLIAINRDNARAQLEQLDQREVSAIFFCGVGSPSSLQPVIRLGRDLVAVQTPAGK